jgi:hypothetical protein
MLASWEAARGQDSEESAAAVGGRLIVQLMLLATIVDPTVRDSDGNYQRYPGAFVEALKFVDGGKIDPVHGMRVVQRRPPSTAIRPLKLGAFRFYSISSILRPAHLVPRDLPGQGGDNAELGAYLVNNYIDWEEYNRSYSNDFERDWRRVVTDYRR